VIKYIRTAVPACLVFVLAVTLFAFWASRSFHSKKYSPVINYSQFKEKASPPGDILTVMTYNIGYASGLKNNQGNVLTRDELYDNLDRIVKTLKKNNTDILAVQEIDFHSKRSHYINQLEYLAHKLKFPYVSYVLNWDKKYVPYPVSLCFKKHFGHMESGQAVLSRFPILENKCYFFIKPLNKPFWYKLFYIERAVQCVKIRLSPSRTIDLYNVHLEAFHVNTRKTQMQQLLDIKVKNDFTSGFILGDFNALPPDASKRNNFSDEPEIDFRSDNTIKTMHEKSNLKEVMVDSFSFPSDNPTRRLDYVFFSEDFILQKGFIDGNAGTGSDHLPVISTFQIK
jgi:endonuclease/exonuclease/phosphatase family metal-dependent hydrolase